MANARLGVKWRRHSNKHSGLQVKASGILFPLPRAVAPIYAIFLLSSGMGCMIGLWVRQDRHGERL